MTGLPGVCTSCRKPVRWTGRVWRNASQGGHRHRCPKDRPVCGAFMRNARERCARKPNHAPGAHRTAFALECERIARKAAYEARVSA